MKIEIAPETLPVVGVSLKFRLVSESNWRIGSFIEETLGEGDFSFFEGHGIGKTFPPFLVEEWEYIGE